MPHPGVNAITPKPFYHPAMGPAYQALQMLYTPGFNPFSPRQISVMYDPISSPASQAMYHPMINPLGMLPFNMNPTPWIHMMSKNPAAFAQHTLPGVMHMNAMANAIPQMGWIAPTPVHV
jgi:hypothetical protein